MFETTQHFLLHEGPEEPARALLHAAGRWTNDLHEEIYVFDSGYWQKDGNLWREVQKTNWADVILEETFKKNLQKDVFGFFDSEELYQNLQIPWKVRSRSWRNVHALTRSAARNHHVRPTW